MPAVRLLYRGRTTDRLARGPHAVDGGGIGFLACFSQDRQGVDVALDEPSERHVARRPIRERRETSGCSPRAWLRELVSASCCNLAQLRPHLHHATRPLGTLRRRSQAYLIAA